MPVLAPSGWNEFAAADMVQFSCGISGPSAARTKGEIRLYRDSEPFGSPQPVANEGKPGKNYLTGDLPLPKDLVPGDYSIRLLTWDKAGGGPARPTATYWSDVTIRN
jgi:hypothetical protein